MDFYPDAPKAQINWTQDPIVLPTVPSTIPDLEAKVTNILAKLDQLPFDQIGTDVTKVLATLDGTLKDVNTTLGGINSDVTPGLKKTLEDLQGVIATADDVLKKRVSDTLSQVNVTLEDLRKPLASADTALKNADQVLKNADTTLLGRDAPVQQDLRDALQEITTAARSLRALMDYLERHPESLIRGKTKQENP
jgi:paraquat-inducible protein B